MALHPQTLEIVVPLIEKYEGVELNAYLCPAGIPTICAGITRYPNGSPVQLGDVCSTSACKGYLAEELEKEFIPGCERIPGFSQMGANRQSTLIDFAWNMGAHFYGASGFDTISRVLREGHTNPEKYDEMRDALMLYVKGGGGVLAGLVKRRTEEADLWELEQDGPMFVKTIHDTYFKKAAIDSSYLSEGAGKLPVKAGNSIEISKLTEISGDSHAEIVVEGTGDKWFIYQPHWEVSSAKKP
jgi:GH24 family phage-related lysozyme (muramidase)